MGAKIIKNIILPGQKLRAIAFMPASALLTVGVLIASLFVVTAPAYASSEYDLIDLGHLGFESSGPATAIPLGALAYQPLTWINKGGSGCNGTCWEIEDGTSGYCAEALQAGSSTWNLYWELCNPAGGVVPNLLFSSPGLNYKRIVSLGATDTENNGYYWELVADTGNDHVYVESSSIITQFPSNNTYWTLQTP